MNNADDKIQHHLVILSQMKLELKGDKRNSFISPLKVRFKFINKSISFQIRSKRVRKLSLWDHYLICISFINICFIILKYEIN